ncbi:hypothetical protein BH18ACT9_BH18ACT9_08690 [soil metagenome]
MTSGETGKTGEESATTRRTTAPDPDEAREGNPNAESEHGLAGDLGLSSERQGPFEGIEGTGTLASAQGRTDGASPTHPQSAGEAHEGDPAKSADVDEERNPAEVHSHDSDPTDHPGHSHG